MTESELHHPAASPVESEELWEGLLFCEEPEDLGEAEAQTPDERAAGDDDAVGTTLSDDAEQLRSAIHDLVHGDTEAETVRQRILELKPAGSCNDEDLQPLGEALAAAFPDYTVFLREGTGSTLRSICLQRLRHKSLVMRRLCPTHASEVYRTARDDALIIDLSFRESFRVPNPSPRYQSLLALLPDVYVAATPSFTAAVELLAKEMAASFKAHNMLTPPWRSPQALLSKWSPTTTTDSLLAPPSQPLPPTSFQPAAALHPVTTQRTAQRTAAPRHPSAKPPGKLAAPPAKPLGIKELLDIPVYSPRRARRRPRPTARPTAVPSSSPSAPPSKLRAVFNSSPPAYTPSQPLPFKPAAPRKTTTITTTIAAIAATEAFPSTPPTKRPYTTAGARPIDQAHNA